jgi:hypothetical protein
MRLDLALANFQSSQVQLKHPRVPEGQGVHVHTLPIIPWAALHTSRVGQNHVYTMCIRYLWQGSHQIYGRIR